MTCLPCCGGDAKRLVDAAKAGDARLAGSLVSAKPKLSYQAQQWGGQTAWHLAAKEGHSAVLQAMADAIRALPPQQLQQQLRRWGGSADEVVCALAELPDSKALTPLHLACIKGRAEAAAALMSYGVNPFVVDSVGRTALHYAASWGHADCINEVLSAHSGPPKPNWEFGAPNTEETPLVDVANEHGFTPLHYAVWVGRKEAIQALASYDASLRATNIANDFDWIRVGTGNTPLHLAAFGGDFEIVKLLLAAHVQTLAAGREVMAAGHGQWGERHADDVRHMRNRRGLMAYHVAIHKGFQHLAELLHPDIPYTFIFSNDDMDVGSVRMFGPSRLMVLAAKALQQKLVDELAAVERGDPGAGPARPQGLEAAAEEAEEEEEAVAAAAAAGGEPGQLPAPEQERPPAAAQPAELLSPFAAKSLKRWTASSFTGSTVSNETAPGSGGAAQPGAGGGAAPAAASRAPGPGPEELTEHSFGGILLNPTATAPPTLLGAAGGGDDSFGGFHASGAADGGAASPAGSRGGHRQYSSAASDVSASMSTSTVPGSTSAVVGTPAGSVVMPESVASSSRGRASVAASPLLWGGSVGSGGARGAQGGGAATQGNGAGGAAGWRAGGRPGAAAAGGAAAAAGPAGGRQLQASASFGAGAPGRRALSSGDMSGRERRAPLRQASRGSDARRGGGAADADASTSGARWLRPMNSLKRNASRRALLDEDVLPASIVVTTAADDDDQGAPASQPPPSGRGSADVGGAAPNQALAPRPSQQQEQQLQCGGSGGQQERGGGGGGQCDNPLDVMLAHRAEAMREDPGAIRQQLVMMKLSSGVLNFHTAVSAFNASLGTGTPDSLTPASSRIASSTRGGAPPRHGQHGLASAGPSAGPSVGRLSAAASADGLAAHHADAAAPPGGGDGGALSPAEPVAAAAAAAAGDNGPFGGVHAVPSLRHLRQTSSLCRSVIAAQPSLQRVLSGSRRSSSMPRRASGESSLAAAGDDRAAAAGGSRRSSLGAPVATAPPPSQQQQQQLQQQLAANGDLPIIQQPVALFGGGGITGAGAGAASGGAGAGDDDDEEGTCEICFDASAAVALQMCGHALCVGCCREMCKLHHFKPALCPYCRQIIVGFGRACR